MKIENKFCVNCKHYYYSDPANEASKDVGYIRHLCRYPVLDHVTGEYTALEISCYDSRRNLCGAGANYFEPK